MNTCMRLALCVLFSINQLNGVDNNQSQKATKWYEDVFDFLGTEQLGYTDASPEIETFVRNLQKELGMESYRIRIKRMSFHAEKRVLGKRNAAVHSFSNLMTIGEKWFKTLTEQEKRALIGHELMHLKQHHLRKQLILNVSTTAFFIFLASKISQKANSKPTPSDFTKLYSTLALMSIPKNWYSRRCEREADILAAQQLKCAPGGVQLFKRFLNEAADPQSRFAFKRFFANLFASHPSCEERIKYLQELADEETKNNSMAITTTIT